MDAGRSEAEGRAIGAFRVADDCGQSKHQVRMGRLHPPHFFSGRLGPSTGGSAFK